MVGSNSSCPFKETVCVIGVFIGLPVSRPNKVLGSLGVYNFGKRWIVISFIFGTSFLSQLNFKTFER